MSFIMPLKSRVFHQAFFFELADRCDCRVRSRLNPSLFDVALRFDLGSNRDFQDVFEGFCEAVFRMTRPSGDSHGAVRVSAWVEDMFDMSSWPVSRTAR
jgi:hypothetical protein